MIRPQLWNRRYSWPEWRRMHSNLNERDAQMLFEQELRMYDMYEQDLINLKENRLVDYVQRLGEYQTIIQHNINYGGVLPTNALGQYISNVRTYNNTITNELVTIPDPPYGYEKYTKVTLEAVGGGGMGQIGYVSNTTGDSKYDLYAVGNGGGGGAYVKRAVTFNSDSPPVITITVGAGGQTKGQDGGASSFTIDGVTATANGGEGWHVTEPPYSRVEPGQDITPAGSIGTYDQAHPITLGGQPAGTYDTGIAGDNAQRGGGLLTPTYNGVLMTGQGGSLSGQVIARRGIGGKSGYPGAEEAAAASITVDSSQNASNFVHAENGKAPGGGGGGGFVDEVTTQGLGDMGAGYGADGRVIVTFGYS